MLSLIVHVRHRKFDRGLRYFCRDTYYCRLIQLKYIFRDYVLRNKYKEITYEGEFAAELIFVLPFAYWHHKNGTLKKTTSSKYTRELYFFSPDHEEKFETRTHEGNYNYEIPRVLYSHDYNISKWAQVPYKEYYQNDVYVFEKPTLIIGNRYNSEWGGPPISYYDIPMLDYIINNLKNDYTILYNRPRPQHITVDNSAIYNLNDYEWLQETHPEVILMEDLYLENKGNAKNYNHFQLMVYANCQHFLSTHGGSSALASCFGGVNIILSKKGPEATFECFTKLYPKLSNVRNFHAKTDDEVKEYLNKYFIKSQSIQGEEQILA
ncbi:hypothetical protein [Pedobacter sp. SYSU D00535]|uniref:hypothetical protein n=1 Tax=Pedobacter sp. SYSU D00535 TaxID=2810308 RepID=UPI001F6166B6|nr:hypothetical protein [Pedobacter sp. SYSU D00535]